MYGGKELNSSENLSSVGEQLGGWVLWCLTEFVKRYTVWIDLIHSKYHVVLPLTGVVTSTAFTPPLNPECWCGCDWSPRLLIECQRFSLKRAHNCSAVNREWRLRTSHSSVRTTSVQSIRSKSNANASAKFPTLVGFSFRKKGPSVALDCTRQLYFIDVNKMSRWRHSFFVLL